MMAEQPKATGGQPDQSTGVSNTPVEARPNTLAQAGIDKNLAQPSRSALRFRIELKWKTQAPCDLRSAI
jgi:hypothetical protein